MATTIALLGCLDTKGDEIAYLERALRTAGHDVTVIDAGILGEAGTRCDISAETVAARAGTSLAALRGAADRGKAIAAMSEGASRVVRALFDAGKIDGIAAAGGSANTTIASTAMQALPVGFPKLLVSTLASGDVSPYVGVKDVTLMYSVVDISGINRLSSAILANAAAAIGAMASRPREVSEVDETRSLIAATMFGVTTPCVTEARRVLEDAGYEVLVFHATGTGGRAMEGLIEDGFFRGVLDITTTELADELVGGVLSAGETRLSAAARKGVPQVVSVGATDMVNFGPRSTVPPRFEGRLFYEHNPTVTLMRTTAEETAEIGRRIGARLSGSRGSTEIVVPLRGVSSIAIEGGVFHDPSADRAMVEALRTAAGSVPIHEKDMEINDPEFARFCAQRLLALIEETNRDAATPSA